MRDFNWHFITSVCTSYVHRTFVRFYTQTVSKIGLILNENFYIRTDGIPCLAGKELGGTDSHKTAK